MKAGEIRWQEERGSVALRKIRTVAGRINFLKRMSNEEFSDIERDADGSMSSAPGLMRAFLTGIFSNDAGCVQVVCQTSVDPAPGIRGHLLGHGKFWITSRQLEDHHATALP